MKQYLFLMLASTSCLFSMELSKKMQADKDQVMARVFSSLDDREFLAVEMILASRNFVIDESEKTQIVQKIEQLVLATNLSNEDDLLTCVDSLLNILDKIDNELRFSSQAKTHLRDLINQHQQKNQNNNDSDTVRRLNARLEQDELLLAEPTSRIAAKRLFLSAALSFLGVILYGTGSIVEQYLLTKNA